MEISTIINIGVILGIVSEAISLIPGLKSNGVIQILLNITKFAIKGIKNKEI